MANNYKEILNELANITNTKLDLSIIDISYIDCLNLNLDEFKNLLNDKEINFIKKECDLANEQVGSGSEEEKESVKTVINRDELLAIKDELELFEKQHSLQTIPKNASPIPTTQPIQPVPPASPTPPSPLTPPSTPINKPKTESITLTENESETESETESEKIQVIDIKLQPPVEQPKPVEQIKPVEEKKEVKYEEPKLLEKSKPVKVFSLNLGNNINNISQVKTLTTRIMVPKKVMTGGGNSGIVISIDKINNALNLGMHFVELFKYYFYNYTELIEGEVLPKILTIEELLLVISVILYVKINKVDFKTLEEIVDPKFINNIPEPFKYNLYDIVYDDLIKIITPEQYNNIKENIISVKKILLKLKTKNNKNFEIPSKKNYLISIYNLQDGGKINRKKTKGYTNSKTNKRVENKTVEERIEEKINKLSTYLKQNTVQRGGALTIAEKLVIINRIDTAINNFLVYSGAIPPPAGPPIVLWTPDQIKREEEKINRDVNTYASELIDSGIVTKEIEDNEFGIARFYLQKVNEAYTPMQQATLDAIILFINNRANTLSFKNRPITGTQVPKPTVVYKLKSTQKPNVSEKLKEYFNKKYERLQLFNSLAENNKKEVKDVVEKIRRIVTGQTGGGEDLIESYFTSKQYDKLYDSIKEYLSGQDKKIDQTQLTIFYDDIKAVKEIEEKLRHTNKIFQNYKKLMDEFNVDLTNDITVAHMEKVLDKNKHLIDKYGNINRKTIDLVKSLETMIEFKNTNDYKEAKKTMEIAEDLDELIYKQSGGGIKGGLRFGNLGEEYFTTKTFQKVLNEINDDN